MSTSWINAGNVVTIFGGIPIFIAGVLGGLLNTLIFLSLQTFRQSSCAFYLTVMSILNIGELVTGIFSRIMIAILGVDGTETSLFYCKFRPYGFQVCAVTSLSCFALATFDQYCATCSRPRWQQFCNIKLARYLVMGNAFIWILHGIPYFVFFNHTTIPATNKTSCTSTNYVFAQYRIYVTLLVLSSSLPVAIAAVFGWMAYRNVQQLAHRAIPLVRRELDKQLTVMVLVQVIINIFTLLPYPALNAAVTNTNLTIDPIIQAKLQFAITVTIAIYYISFASPFYIYICVSERFRRQLIHVLFKIHLNRWRQPRMGINQIAPQT